MTLHGSNACLAVPSGSLADRSVHSAEREALILAALRERGFVSYRSLKNRLAASPATIRRDLLRLQDAGHIARVHGGAKIPGSADARPAGHGSTEGLRDPLLQRREAAIQAVGQRGADLCRPGEAIMLGAGTTTLQMCSHIAGMNLQVLTNSLLVIHALLSQAGTRVLVPSGTVFREQNIVLAATSADPLPRFHAPKLFIGAAAVGPQGVMQRDGILVSAERRFIDRAEEVILLVDSSKFIRSSGAIVCSLDQVDVAICDREIPPRMVEAFRKAGTKLLVCDA